MKTFKKVLSLALALVMVVGALVVLPTEAKAADSTTSVWSGSQTIDSNWSGTVSIEASKFADLKFDGTEKLVVTYSAVNAGTYYSAIKFGCTDPYADITSGDAIPCTAATSKYYVDLTSAYSDIATTGLLIMGCNLVITDVSVWTVDVDTTNVYTGSFESGSWANNLSIAADKFADCEFDGTEKLAITYVATDTSNGTWVNFKLAVEDPYTALVEPGVMVVSAPTVVYLDLTEDWAAIATGGLMVQGHNWTISSVDVLSPVEEQVTNPTPDTDKVPTAGDFSMVLPLVLVLMGGAVVFAASKKRFA